MSQVRKRVGFCIELVVGFGLITLNGSCKMQRCRLSGTVRTGSVQVHHSRTQKVSHRDADAAGIWPTPEIGIEEGLTVEMMGVRVCTIVAG